MNDFWRGKKVLITGHTGFKGTWLAVRLLQLGAEVYGVSLKQNEPRAIYNAVSLSKYINGEKIIDIRNGDDLQVLRKNHYDIIFHLAAQSLVLESYANPVLTYEVNVIGTLNILELFRYNESAKVAVVVTSDKCYENKETKRGYVETDEMGGIDPYSSSKGCCEILVSSYRRAFLQNLDKAIASVRAGNVVGGGDFANNRLVPDCIRSLENNEEIVLRHPQAVRPWQHVIDPLSGYILLAEKLWSEPQKYSGGWNFGPSEDNLATVEELVKQIITFYGYGKYRCETRNEHEANYLALNCEKALKLLNWRTKFSFSESLELALDWYKHPSFEKCIEQYERYDAK